MDLEKDDYQKVICNNEHCPYSTWMHLQCFYEWESSILVQFNCIGRARSWNEKQCRQNMWTKKGYDLAFRFCSCRCGQGHLKKDTDWYQVKRMQDDKKKKSVLEKSTGRSVTESAEEAKKGRPANKPQKGLSNDLQRRHSMDRQNSQEKGVMGGSYAVRSPCVSPGQSPPTGYSILAPTHFSGPRSSRYLGEFLKNAIHLEPHKKSMAGGGMYRNAHFDYGAAGLQAHRSGHFDTPVQFLRRLDLSELLTHIPRHKLNTFHVRMEDDAQVGQGEDLRKFILAALSASHRNVVNCALCHRALPVFEQFPLVDGTLFLSPSRHDEIEYDVPCHLQGTGCLSVMLGFIKRWNCLLCPVPAITDFHPGSTFLSSSVKFEVISNILMWIRSKHLEGIKKDAVYKDPCLMFGLTTKVLIQFLGRPWEGFPASWFWSLCMLIDLLGSLLQDAHHLFNISVLCCSLAESCLCTTDEGEVPLICFQATEYEFCFIAK